MMLGLINLKIKIMAENTVIYEGQAQTGPFRVFITPNSTNAGYMSVALLYAASSTGSFSSDQGLLKNYELKQGLTQSENEAIDLVSTWLKEIFDCIPELTKQSS